MKIPETFKEALEKEKKLNYCDFVDRDCRKKIRINGEITPFQELTVSKILHTSELFGHLSQCEKASTLSIKKVPTLVTNSCDNCKKRVEWVLKKTEKKSTL